MNAEYAWGTVVAQVIGNLKNEKKEEKRKSKTPRNKTWDFAITHLIIFDNTCIPVLCFVDLSVIFYNSLV